MRVGGSRIPVVPQQNPPRAEPKSAPKEVKTPEVQPKREVSVENFITSLSAHRQPPKMPLSSLLTKSPTSVASMFAQDLEKLENRSTEDVAGDLAMTYLTYETIAVSEGDGALKQAFEEMGELMRGYEHIRMLKTGELG